MPDIISRIVGHKYMYRLLAIFGTPGEFGTQPPLVLVSSMFLSVRLTEVSHDRFVVECDIWPIEHG